MKVYLVYCMRLDETTTDTEKKLKLKDSRHVCAVFSNEELAKKYKDYWNDRQKGEWIHWVIEETLDFYADTTKELKMNK